MNIPAEAVEAAAKVVYEVAGHNRRASYGTARIACRLAAKKVLEEAAPYLMAEAWDRAASSIVDERGNPIKPTNVTNPYIRQS